MAERYVSHEQREELREHGDTAYGDSFPMGDCDEVRRAVESIGRAPAVRRPAVRREAIKRHRELHCSHPLPPEWSK
jgi:hypothetical protein